MEDNQKCGLSCCICAVISLIILLSMILKTVEPTFYGLKCNWVTKKCSADEVSEAGRHLVWPTQYFIQFPGTLQTIEFKKTNHKNAPGPLGTRTFDGLNLTLYLSFQYRLQKDAIPSLYKDFQMMYEATFIKIARDSILQNAALFNASQYWEIRSDIGTQMKQQLNEDLQIANANCTFLQILNIILPEQYEESIVITQVETQKKKMKQFEQEATLINQQIDVLKSETNQHIKEINASAVATAYFIKQSAQANANEMTISAEAYSYNNTRTMFGMNEDQLNEYIYYITLMQKNSSELLVGMETVLADARN